MVEVPNLPGYKSRTVVPANTRHKTHFGIVNEERVELVGENAKPVPRLVRRQKYPAQAASGEAGETGETVVLPAWEALSGCVLRFYGYFLEKVVESNLETERVRFAVVLFYLEDGTVQVNEPRRVNSGLLQGALTKRVKIEHITPASFTVGKEIEIFARHVILCSCDAYTRDFYASGGLEGGLEGSDRLCPQPPSIEIPGDNFSALLDVSRAAAATGGRLEKTYDKVYREVMLGSGLVNPRMRQFLENDRKVCRFYAVVDDVSTPHFERRPFIIFYFLADDTVEIREQYPLNAGRDEFALFLRRARLPRPHQPVLNGPTNPPLPAEAYMTISDFFVGQKVSILGLDFFIHQADEATRDFFAQKLKRPLGPAVDVTLPESTPPRPATPPYTGYGSWDDSMGSVYALVPKVPKKDMHKLFANEGRVLRFSAKLAHPSEEDKNRRFVLSFYLADDQLMVHEPPQRNSGIVTGRFLEKNVYVNEETGKLVQPGDLAVGSILRILGREFEILEADKFSEAYLTSGGNNSSHHQGGAGRSSSTEAVFAELRKSLKQQFPVVRAVFRKFDSDKNSVFTIEEIRQCLLKFGFAKLSDDQALEVMAHFDRNGDGQVTYTEFCEAIFAEEGQLGAPAPVTPEYREAVKKAVATRVESEKIRRAVREVGDAIYKHHNLDKRIILNLGARSKNHRVSSVQVRQAFAECGQFFDQSDVDRVCSYLLQSADLATIDYVALVKALNASFHDLPASR